jgi:hypothetical protein
VTSAKADKDDATLIEQSAHLLSRHHVLGSAPENVAQQ